MINKRIILKYLIALLGILLTGCAGKTPLLPAESTIPVNKVGTLEEYYLQPGDNLEILFYNTPELNREVTIRPDGKLSLPPLDEFLAAGLTPDQLDKTLTQKYKDELKQPVINVILKGFAGQRIYVGGEVNSPMILYLAGKTNAFQAIFNAGGLTDDAKLSTVMIVSKSEKNQPIAKIVDLKKALTGELPESEYLLKPFDMV
jgi:polysaccharide export outer membrane protein